MHDFYIFVAAIIFVIVALPVLQTLSDIICGFGQWIISIINVHVTNNNVKSQSIQEPENTQAIGFQAPDESDYYDDDDEPDEKLKIGFRG